MTEYNYISSKQLTKTVLRMKKDYTSFVYFTLESNENIAFYSTLPFEKGQNFRDIVVYTTPELEKELKNIIAHCNKNGQLTILEESLISDQ